MAATDTYPLINRIVPGGLDAFLSGARAEGLSHEQIAYRLRSQHDIEISAETIRKWCQRLEPAGDVA